MHFTRHSTYEHGGARADHRPRRGRLHLDDQRQAVPRRAGRAVRRPGRARPAASWRRRPRKQARSWRSSRSGPTRTRARSSWPSASPTYAPGRPQQGLLHHRRRRGGRDRLEARQAVLQARRQADEAQGDQPRRSPTTARRRARWRSPASRPPRRCSSRSSRAASGCRTPTSTGRRSTRDDAEGVRPLGRRPHRGSDRVRRSRHRRGRLPRAGAELRRLLPAAARLLPAGPGDLRPARRAARLRRGHLRVRPDRQHVRLQTTTATCPT